MRKFLSFLLVAALLATCLPAVFAAGSASFTGPDAVRAGDTITLTFSAGGGILGGQGSLSYDPSLLTLKSCTSCLGGNWNVTVPGNNGDNLLFYYDGSDMANDSLQSNTPIFKATFTVGALEEGSEISVSVKNVILSAGDQDMPLGTKTYRTTVLPPLSGNCTLADLTVSNAEISPAFSPEVTSYSASVPFTTSSLKVEAAAEHSGAKVTVKNTSLTAGETTTVKIVVKAENGTEKTYSIKVKRAQDPNYVPSGNAKLQALTVEGFQLSPAFSPDVDAYYVWLPYEAESLKLTASAADKKSALKIGESAALEAGKATVIPVTVTAENGTQLVYTVTAVRAPAHADTKDFLDARIPAPVDPEPTEPTVPETRPAVQPTEPAPLPQETDFSTQIIILAGACAACLILGLLLGVLLFRRRNLYTEDYEEESEETSDDFSDDMPKFDPSDDNE